MAEINIQQLKHYLKLLYKVNNRKIQTSFSPKKDVSNRLLRQVLSCIIIGFPLLFIMYTINNLDFALFMSFTFIMVFMILSFISECSDVLFNTTDNSILFHRPINSRTIFAGRLIYMLIYGLVYGLAMAIIPLIYLFITEGWLVFTGFLLGTITAVFFSVSFSVFIYMVLVKAIGGEKFKKVLFVFQIVISFILILVINIDKTYLEEIDFNTINFLSEFWVLFIPPAWEFGLVDLISGIDISINSILLSILAIVAPLIISYISLSFLSDSFKSDMIGFANDNNKIVKQRRFGVEKVFASIFTKTRQEAGIFTTVFKILLRDRDFMVKMYSSSAMFITVIGLNIYGMFKKDTVMYGDKIDVMIVLILYTASTIFMMSSEIFAIGAYKDVSDRYRCAPIEKPGILNMAILKSLYCIFFIPIFTLIAIILSYMWGVSVLFDIVVVFFASSIIAIFWGFYGKKKFPLSLNKAERGITSFFLFLSSAILGVIHWGLKMIPYALPVYVLILCLYYFILINKLMHSKWKDFK